MPPTLDLAKTYTHADLLVPSPRISLRRAASYNGDRSPKSSTSSRFSFNHLIASPPPSPGLPALVPRHGKPLPTRAPRKVLRGATWFVGLLAMLYLGVSSIGRGDHVSTVRWGLRTEQKFELVGDSTLPSYPTPVIITDKRGRAKWTVSIPPNYDFPLAPKQYADICQQTPEVAYHVQELHSHFQRSHSAHHGYHHDDPNFLDVREAEEQGLLPGSEGLTAGLQGRNGAISGKNIYEKVETEICGKSMTVVLETSEAGLGKTLMMLWTAYGLAVKEERQFFIDDSRWVYGKYTNYFQSPPIPACRPPSRHEMLPCPRTAHHLIVSAATARYTLGTAYDEQVENTQPLEIMRRKPFYDLARTGYEALFQLMTTDSDYVKKRIIELRAKTEQPFSMLSGQVIGVHVRHGDRHPEELLYKDSYIPLTTYIETAENMINASSSLFATSPRKSLIVTASDDPDVYSSFEVNSMFTNTVRAQERIQLASQSRVSPQEEPQSRTVTPRKFVEETVGWEGGFFSGMFWSLGRSGSVPSTATYVPSAYADDGHDNEVADTRYLAPPTEEALRLRELVGRAYLLDLAVLGQSDGVVCTVSSVGCRILAIMLGWKKTFEEEEQGWRNVDGKWDWKGIDW